MARRLPRTADGSLPYLVQGDTWTETVLLENGDGNAIDITGDTFTLRLRFEETQETVFQQTMTIASGTGGEVFWDIASADTADLDPGDYTLEVEREQASGDIRTLFQLVFEVRTELEDTP